MNTDSTYTALNYIYGLFFVHWSAWPILILILPTCWMGLTLCYKKKLNILYSTLATFFLFSLCLLIFAFITGKYPVGDKDDFPVIAIYTRLFFPHLIAACIGWVVRKYKDGE